MQRYEAYRDSGVEWIGEIPEGWEIRRLKTLAVNDIRKTPTNQGAYIGLENIQPWTQRFLESAECSNDPEGNYYDEDCVLFGKLRPYLAKVFVPTESGQCSSEFLILRSELLSLRYLSYSLINGRFIDEVNSLTYGAKMPRASWETIGSIPSPLPSAREQAAIADYLDEKTAEIDSIVSQTERSIGLLREYRKSVISEAVTKGLDPDAPMKDSGVEWIGEIPAGWEVARLKNLLVTSMQYGATEAGCDFSSSLPRYIRITDIDEMGRLRHNDRKSLASELAAPFLLEDCDLLFARSGATVGKSFLYRSEYGEAAFAGYLIRARLDQKKMIPRLLELWTQSGCYESWKNAIFNQATIQNIGADKYSVMPLPVPPLPEQQAIAGYLDEKTAEIDSLIDDKQRQVELLREYRKSLISEAVTGKFKVPGLE